MTDNLKPSLDSLLAGATGLIREAFSAMPAAEVAALSQALSERTQISVTMLLPSGMVRVGVVGEWAGERELWSMEPVEPLMQRELNA